MLTSSSGLVQHFCASIRSEFMHCRDADVQPTDTVPEDNTKYLTRSSIFWQNANVRVQYGLKTEAPNLQPALLKESTDPLEDIL